MPTLPSALIHKWKYCTPPEQLAIEPSVSDVLICKWHVTYLLQSQPFTPTLLSALLHSIVMHHKWVTCLLQCPPFTNPAVSSVQWYESKHVTHILWSWSFPSNMLLVFWCSDSQTSTSHTSWRVSQFHHSYHQLSDVAIHQWAHHIPPKPEELIIHTCHQVSDIVICKWVCHIQAIDYTHHHQFSNLVVCKWALSHTGYIFDHSHATSHQP
jgi:hypothetical protein